MAMNMMGLGFAFGAKDKGLGKMVDKTTKGIGLISGAVKTIGAQASKFSLGAMFNIPQQAMNTMQAISADTRVTTTSLEEFGIQADKASRKAIAGLNLTTKESKKARKEMSSTAYSTGIDIGTVTESWKSLAQNQVKVTQMGFKSFKQYSKFMQVTSTDSKEFAAGMGHAQHTLGMTGKEMQNLIETTLALGKQMDQGTEAVPSMLKKMKLMRETGAALFDSWSKEKTTKFLHSTQLVTGALQKSGMTFEAADAASDGFLNTLIKGEQSFHALYQGLDTDMDGLGKVLSENFMGPAEAFKLLEKSPHEFMLQMTKATDQIGKLADQQIADEMGIADASSLSGKKKEEYEAKSRARRLKFTGRFSQQMSKLVGSDMTTLFMSQSGKVMKQVEALGKDFEKVGGKKGSIGKMSKEFRTGRSATVNFARAQALLVTKMKHLDGTMKSGTFLQEYNQSSKLVISSMRGIAKKGGPVAKAMTTLIDFSNFGLGGVISRLHPMGPALTTVMEKFAPYLQMLPALAVGFKALFSPMTLIVAALGGIYLALKFPEEASKAFAKFSDAVERYGPKIYGVAKEIAVGIAKAIAKVFIFIWDHIDWAKVQTKLYWVAEKIGEGIKWALLKVLDFAEMLIQAFGNINFDTIKKYLTIGFKYAFYAIVLAVGWVLKQLPDLMRGAFKILYAVIFSFFDGIRDAFKEQFPRWAKFFDTFFGTIKYAFIALTAFMIARWVAMTGIAIAETTKTWLWKKKVYLMSKYYELEEQMNIAAGYVAKKALALEDFLWTRAEMIKEWALKTYHHVQEKMREEGFFVWKMAKLTAWAAYSVAKFLIVGAAQTAMWLAGQIAAVAMWAAALFPIAAVIIAITAVGAAVYAIVEYWDEIVDYFKGLGKKIGKIFKGIGETILDWLMWPIDKVKAAYNGVKDAIGGFFSDVGSFISDTVSSAVGMSDSGTESAVKNIKDQAKTIERAGKDAQGWFKGATDKIKKDTRSAVLNQQAEGKKLGGSLTGMIEGVKNSSKKAANAAMSHLMKLGAEAKKHWADLKGEKILKKNESEAAKLMKQYENMDKARAMVGGKAMEAHYGKKTIAKAQASIDAVGKKYQEETGRSMKLDAEAAASVVAKFQVNKAAVKKLSAVHRAAFVEKRKRTMDAFTLEGQELKNLHFKEEISAKELAQREELLNRRMQVAANEQKLEFAMRSGGLSALTELAGKFYKGQQLAAVINAAQMEASYSEFISKTKNLMSTVPKEFKEAAQASMDALNEGYREEVRLLDTKKLKAAEYKIELGKIDQAFSDNSLEVVRVAQLAQKELLAGATIQTGIDKIEKQTEKFKASVKENVKVAATEAEQILSESFGVTNQEAMNFLKDMVGVDPAGLKKSLTKIKKQYIAFLAAVQVQGKKLLKDTKVQFGEYQKTFEEFWKDMENFANDYGQKILTISRNFWTAILGLSRNGTTQMTAAATLMISTLETNFKKVNILDILTAGGKIRSWAIRIVEGLQAAFSGTNPFDTAIEIAARNATAIIKSMEGERGEKGTVTPVSRMSHRQVSTQSARSKVRDDLIAATNEPTWSIEAKEQRDRANAILENGFRTLLMLNAGGSAQKKTERALNRGTINLREAPDI